MATIVAQMKRHQPILMLSFQWSEKDGDDDSGQEQA